METTQLAYNSPAAKARIKELKAIEAAAGAQCKAAYAAARAHSLAQQADNPAYRSWDDPTHEAISAQADGPLATWNVARTERLQLQTAPLPCKDSELPASAVDPATLVAGPQDTAAYQPGDQVALHSRGAYRLAVVVEARKTNIEVAYTTQGAIAEAMRYGRGPEGATVTRKVAKPTDLYNHQPKGVAAA